MRNEDNLTYLNQLLLGLSLQGFIFKGGDHTRPRGGHDPVRGGGRDGHGSGGGGVQPGQLAARLGAARGALAALGRTHEPAARRGRP